MQAEFNSNAMLSVTKDSGEIDSLKSVSSAEPAQSSFTPQSLRAFGQTVFTNPAGSSVSPATSASTGGTK